jgi:hypothetical protein
MNALTLFDERWIPYCNSSTHISSDISVLQLVPIVLCSLAGIALLVVFVRHATGDKHFITSTEFEEANERIVAHILLLESCKEEGLRLLCRCISRDLLRATNFVANDVARYIPKNNSESFQHLTIALMRKNTMRLNAIQIEVLYYVKPLRTRMVMQTNRSVEIFARAWLPLLEQYCLTLSNTGRF